MDAPGRRLPALAILRALIFASEHKRRGASEHHLAGVRIEEFEHPRLGARDQALYVFNLCRGKVERQFRLQLAAPVLVYFESNKIDAAPAAGGVVMRAAPLLLIDKRDIVYR